MPETKRITCLSSTALWVAALACVPAVLAEERVHLQWNLPEGSTWRLSMHSQTDSRVGFGGKLADTRIETTVDLTWHVQSRQPDRLMIRQTINRLVMELTSAPATVVRFDSASQERPPPGPSAELAAALRPLVGSIWDLTISTRGEVLTSRLQKPEVDPPPAASEPSSAGHEMIVHALSQPLVVLPPAAAGPGATWEHQRSFPSPLGPVLLQTVFRLGEASTQEGTVLWPIHATATLVLDSPESDATAQHSRPASATSAPRRNPVVLKDFQQTSTAWFAAEQGRLVRLELKQQLTTEQVYRDTTITATVRSQQQIRLEPKHAASPAASSAIP